MLAVLETFITLFMHPLNDVSYTFFFVLYKVNLPYKDAATSLVTFTSSY